MPLRKSPTMTPQRLAANRANRANRANAQHSTGPKSSNGKRRSRLNALRSGRGSATYQRLVDELSVTPPSRLRDTAAAILTPEELDHPLYRREIENWQNLWDFCARQSPQ